MEKYALIVAGGSGQRMGNVQPKQFIPIAGKPVVWHTVSAFLSCYDDMRVVLVLPESFMTTGQDLFHNGIAAGSIQIVKGGDNRFQSVKNGLTVVPSNAMVFVHDAVRCLVTHELIQRCYTHALIHGSAVPVISPADSTRFVENKSDAAPLPNTESHVIDRSRVRLVQTPQTFPAGLLQQAFQQPYTERFSDEATVYESAGFNVHLVEGDRSNIKITYPNDLFIAEQLLHLQQQANNDQ